MSVLKAEKFCAAFAWNGTGTKMAAASVAGAMDDDFSSDAYIQIFDASLTNFERPNMPLLSKTSIPDRVHKLDWSPHGGGEGIIAAGLTDGTVCVWSASSLLEQKSEEATEGENPALLYQSRLHQQAVKGCQFNPLQPHFLATGSADKELCIWSFQDPKNPVKVPSISTTTQAAEVTDLRWNPKYAHILAVTLSNGGVVVWDLKAKRPASTFNVSSNATMAASALTWHPEVATQLVVARDDPSPVIQIWDLKKATAPFREIAVHTGGVLAMSWSPFDVNVLVSCGRDGRTCFVNPNTGALLGELPKQDNWVFDVKWAPRTPAVVASASYDSQLALFATQAVCASAEAPKWLSRPSPTVFGYGGRIGHTQNSTVRITTSSSDTSLSKQENEFLSAIAAAPVGTTVRADFIATIPPGGLSSVAAAARCSALGEKGPLLEELGVAPSEVVKTAEEVGMPFTGSERDFEQVVARCVACGKFSDAVTVCLKANRFDDGFAIAQMAGKEEVSRVYDAYLERRSPTLRFAKYLGAIAKGDFAQLAADAAEKRVPWAEVLAFYSTVVQPRDYSATCSALGAALRDREQLDAAFTCFVSGGDVDNAAATLVAKRDRKQHELVQAVTALEQTVQRQARCKEYAEVLAGHANSLAFEGNFAAAMAYASRAAGLGVHEAAVVADRVRFLVPRDKRLNVAAAFQIVREAPDPYTPECVMLAGKQVPLRTNVAKPVHQPTVTRPHIVAPGPLTHTQPAPTHPTQPVAPTHPVAPLPHHHHHHHHHTTQPPITHPAPPVPLPPAPVRHADPVATQPVAPVPFTPAPAPTPVAKAVTPAPVAPRPAPTTAGGALQCSSVDTSSVAPENQSIVSAIVAATTAIADKRKREAVDKSATELLRRLASGALSEPVAALLRDFCAKLGTPESKQVWKSLNDNHFDDIAPFLNIKFL